MNIERLNALIDDYIANFNMINGGNHDENMKWRAIHHFKKNFDLDAPNFYDMFKNAMSKSSIIINNGTVQPINGILKLISHEEDTMRGLFAMLYEDDGGDLDRRQERIEQFVDETNKLLKKYEPGKWKYAQEFRSALAYLMFYKPEENYFYKSSQCQPFFRYLEYGEEIGYGHYFKLSRYYKMCDEVRTLLSQHPKLMETHSERWKDVDDPKDDLHILTFDIIYCSIVYGFYESGKYTKIAHKSKVDLEREKLENAIKETEEKIDELEAQLIFERQILDAIPEIDLEGQIVKHKTLGVGKIVKQFNKTIGSNVYIIVDVEFATKIAQLDMKHSLACGLLSSEDSTILERCKMRESAIAVCGNIEKAIQSKKSELDSLIAKLK